MKVHLFAGPGGWEVGQRLAGYEGASVGVEWDTAACRTATAAGHARIQADVSTLDPTIFAAVIDTLVGSPPCPTFSMSGNGAGRALIEILATAMTRMARGQKVFAQTRRAGVRALRTLARRTRPKDTRVERTAWMHQQVTMSMLVLQPLRWVLAAKPRAVALEQVPLVLPLWTHLAVILRELGYKAWAGVLSAEEYGVPQTRKRAILVARRDGLPVGPPPPTHQAFRAGHAPSTDPDLFGAVLPPAVSMAESLGWGLPDRPAWTVTAGGAETGGAEVFGNAKCRAELRDAVMANGRQPRATQRTAAEPAATVYCSRPGNLTWHFDRPATTVQVTPRIGRPGHKDRAGGEAQVECGSVAVSVEEAGVLQSFPPDYPWRGTKTQRHRQVGDAVPPLLAAAILRPLLRTPLERAA